LAQAGSNAGRLWKYGSGGMKKALEPAIGHGQLCEWPGTDPVPFLFDEAARTICRNCSTSARSRAPFLASSVAALKT
jgi:hypothetical protein